MTDKHGVQLTEVDYDPFATPELDRAVVTTAAQREVWLADRLGTEASLAYNESVTLRMDGPLDEAALAAAAADFLVIVVPYEKETHKIVNARIFAAMKPSAFVVNIARGGVLDEQDLLQAIGAFTAQDLHRLVHGLVVVVLARDGDLPHADFGLHRVLLVDDNHPSRGIRRFGHVHRRHLPGLPCARCAPGGAASGDRS